MVDFLGNVLGMMVPDLRLHFESVFLKCIVPNDHGY